MLFFFDDRISFYDHTYSRIGFELGGYYKIGRHVTRCIKCTPTAFNFVDIKTSIVVFKNHFYAMKLDTKLAERKNVPEKVKANIFYTNNSFRNLRHESIKPLDSMGNL
jgi:hypothetical protein